MREQTLEICITDAAEECALDLRIQEGDISPEQIEHALATQWGAPLGAIQALGLDAACQAACYAGAYPSRPSDYGIKDLQAWRRGEE